MGFHATNLCVYPVLFRQLLQLVHEHPLSDLTFIGRHRRLGRLDKAVNVKGLEMVFKVQSCDVGICREKELSVVIGGETRVTLLVEGTKGLEKQKDGSS